ncbi:NAD-dependent epimerase/dehydratase family protein [Advenella mimigardefordensis]|uniref:NAD(P)-binding Rossmann-fold domain-containing protein n=1 Tax=Advenella mimigardefordensis (strain DSM 17166 / LMG 22922 / DPN7) TaxID=1247726 RepID=W0PER3_ADVMD|nr:NAD-dependent epimerase/dehydratase family protein [Advenella mimigardefordensis]AHG65464.1 NAD(P)-binding Rossmann-fold domain-containing protein [Advenella mimigardefordensis DPN7]
MNTLLLVGGDLCERTARLLDPAHWRCIGLRRSKVASAHENTISWRQADLLNQESLSFLGADEFSAVTHVLYAPSPDSRTIEHYAGVYSLGLPGLLNSLPPSCLKKLQRCVLVGSSAVWAPSDEWVDENTPVQQTNFRASALLEAEAALHASLAPGAGVALRLSGLYGPGRQQLLKGLQAGTITAPDGPGHWANRIHIDDAAQACAHLLTVPNPQPLYIGTDDCPMPTAQFYDELAKLLGAPAPARQIRPPSGKRLSNARLRASGWEPTWPNALEWYAKQQA